MSTCHAEAQALCLGLRGAPPAGVQAPLAALALQGGYLLWGDTGAADAAALVALAAAALTPHAAGPRSAWQRLRGAALATTGRCAFLRCATCHIAGCRMTRRGCRDIARCLLLAMMVMTPDACFS